MVTQNVFAKLGRVICSITTTVLLVACTPETRTAASGPPGLEADRAREVVPAFIEGCLAPLPNLRTATAVFDNYNIAYQDPVATSYTKSRASRSAELHVVTTSDKPFTRRGPDAMDWNTDLTGCVVRRAGTFGAEAHGEIIKGLARQGFRTRTALPAPQSRGSERLTGRYTRDGRTYFVEIIQVIPGSPGPSGNDNIRYIRGNKATFLAIVQDPLPRGNWYRSTP